MTFCMFEEVWLCCGRVKERGEALAVMAAHSWLSRKQTAQWRPASTYVLLYMDYIESKIMYNVMYSL